MSAETSSGILKNAPNCFLHFCEKYGKMVGSEMWVEDEDFFFFWYILHNPL